MNADIKKEIDDLTDEALARMGRSNELIFNVQLSFWQKILLLFGWHVQVRTHGPLAQWGITRESKVKVIAAFES